MAIIIVNLLILYLNLVIHVSLFHVIFLGRSCCTTNKEKMPNFYFEYTAFIH